MSVLPRHSHWLTRLDSRPKDSSIEAQRLADLARCRLAAIGNDVGCHCGAQFAVTLIDVLDGLLALLFRGQIEIDVRPLSTALAQKTLEEQLHADRINGRDLECIADGGIGRTAAALDQNVVAFAELDDVPNDEEVSGKAKLCDQRQLMFHLLLCALHQAAIVLWSIASLHAFCNALSQKAIHRLAIRHRIAWKLIAKIAQFKLRREERSTVFSIASGTSRKSAAISRAGRRCR